MKRESFLKRLTLRGALFASVPIVLLGLYLVAASTADVLRIRQFDDWFSRERHIENFGWDRVRALVTAPLAWQVDHRISPEDETLSTLRLHVERHAFDRLGEEPLAHFGEQIKAAVETGGELHPVKLKLRGDTSVHWSTEKKSLTLKASRGHMLKGYRQLIFSAKEVIPAYLANSLPSEFDVPGSNTSLVPVFVNERFWGLYRFVEPIDETFLRKHVLLPGNVFRADTAERGEYYKGLEREVFKNLYIWDRAAKNDRPGSIGTAALGEWLHDLNGTTFDDYRRFERWLDRSQCAHMFALQLAVGDPFHMSGVHNQYWYEDPSSGLLRQLPWDLRLLDLKKPPPDSHYNRGLRTILRDPRVLDEALEILRGKLEGDKLFALAKARMDDVSTRFADVIRYEHLRGGSIPEIGSPEDCLAILRANLEILKTWLADARIDWSAEKSSESTVLDARSRGFAGADLVALELDGIPADAKPKLYADSRSSGTWTTDDREIAAHVEGSRLVLDEPQALLPGANAEKPVLAPEAIAYRFFLSGIGDAKVRPILVNRHTHAPVQASEWKRGEAIGANSSWHPWQFVAPSPAEMHLAGEQHLTQTLVVPENTTLVIEAGAHLVLDPNVSIFTRSQVIARGTEEKPIAIENADPLHPWGSFALQGAGCNDSRFEWIRLHGGGGALLDRVEYTGMVCVHNAKNVWWRHCDFGPNLRCDDTIHGDRSDLNIENCAFHHANGDSIDFDMSTGLIKDCLIENSGNDGLDLMTCTPRIIHNHIVGSQDKGISIGEASTPFVFDNLIEGCQRAIEAKDTSQPIVLNNRFAKNHVGVRARLKNWRYDYGGWPKLVNTIVIDNDDDTELHERTHLTIAGAQIGKSDSIATPVELPWLEAEVGVRTHGAALGQVDQFELVDPIAPIARGTFRDDFGLPSNGWVHDVGVHSLDKRGENLVATFKRTKGTIGLDVDWDLRDPSKRYFIVLELAGENLEPEIELATAESAKVTVTRKFELHEEADQVLDQAKAFEYVPYELEPKRYSAIALAATPKWTPDMRLPPDHSKGSMPELKPSGKQKGSGAHLFLHSWRVVALSKSTNGGR